MIPERMHLVDLRTGEDWEVMFNPEELNEQVDVNYARMTVPGLSHEPLHYINTSNHGVSLDLFVIGNDATARGLSEVFRRFLLSLTVPSGVATDIAGGAPPRVLFVWPQMFSMVIAITKVGIKHKRFALSGASNHYVASITFEENREGRVTSETVRRLGTRRSAAAAGSSEEPT